MTATPIPLPPTPTFLPPGTPVFMIPTSYSLWASAPYAIQSWNMIGAGKTVIQVVLLIAVIIVFAYVLMRFGRDFTSGGTQE